MYTMSWIAKSANVYTRVGAQAIGWNRPDASGRLKTSILVVRGSTVTISTNVCVSPGERVGASRSPTLNEADPTNVAAKRPASYHGCGSDVFGSAMWRLNARFRIRIAIVPGFVTAIDTATFAACDVFPVQFTTVPETAAFCC